jgi:hypothetical protein
MNIKNKLIALGLVCAMAMSAVACADKDSTDSDSSSVAADADIQVQETFSSEEIEQLQKHELEFSPVTDDESGEDAVESILGAESSDSSSDSQSSDSSSSDSQSSGNSSNSSAANDSSDSDALIGTDDILSTEPVFIPGGDESNADAQESAGSGTSVSNSVITGTKQTYQVFWMDLTKGDYIFDGEYITATFKIKDDAPNGTYPITIDWMDFANYSCKTVTGMTGVDGSVVVGSEATPNSFENGGNFEIMAENVSGNPGDTVTVSFKLNNNPGFVACLFRFGYDSDVLEFVSGDKGSDFEALM